MASSWGNVGIASFQSINRRFKASKATNDYMSMLSNFGTNNTKENVGIIYVSKTDGKEGKKIILADKDPDYQLDEIDRMVFVKNSNNELTAYKF